MNDLPVEQTWLILVDLLTDLRKKGIEIPEDVPKNVRLARSTINFYKSDPTNPEMMKELKRINDFLNSIQDTLLDIAEEVGSEYRDEWLQKLMRASRGEKVVEKEETTPRFVVGAPEVNVIVLSGLTVIVPDVVTVPHPPVRVTE
jgi:hypothetical protein